MSKSHGKEEPLFKPEDLTLTTGEKVYFSVMLAILIVLVSILVVMAIHML